MVTMMAGLTIYFVAGMIAAPLVHGPMLGGMLGSMWAFAMIALAAFYLVLKRSMMDRWTGAAAHKHITVLQS